MYTWDGGRVDFTLYPRSSKIDLDHGMPRLNSLQQHGSSPRFEYANRGSCLLLREPMTVQASRLKRNEMEHWLNNFGMRIS